MFSEKEKKTFAVIFDMDGVLVNSTEYVWDAFNRVVKPMGIHFDTPAIRKYLGRSLRDQIVMWKEDYGVDVGDPKTFSDAASAMQLELMRDTLVIDRDVLVLLQELKAKSVPMGVGTSSNRTRAEAILTLLDIRHYFGALVTADEIQEHKPHPHIFLEVARQLNMPAEHCVVIEDDPVAGIQAAKSGNMKSVGFVTEWNTKEDFHAADMVIQNFGDLSYGALSVLFV